MIPMKNTRKTFPNFLQRAFTLIEMMVVVAIMSILTALLMPAVSHTRETARTMQCMSNLRQFGQAVHLYAGDNEQHIPMITNQFQQFTVFLPYIPDSSGVYHCPSVRQDSGLSGASYGGYNTGTGVNFRYTDYTFNDFSLTTGGSLAKFRDFSLIVIMLEYDWAPPRHNIRKNVLFLDGHVENRIMIGTQFDKPDPWGQMDWWMYGVVPGTSPG
jgi:prepilin-type N-terminal cleavage/methylation domain-containing protein/prepilin-type processing-associated H-X9-DG protein